MEATITVKPSYGLSDAEIARMLQESFAHAADDMTARALTEAQVEADRIVGATEAALAADRDLPVGRRGCRDRGAPLRRCAPRAPGKTASRSAHRSPRSTARPRTSRAGAWTAASRSALAGKRVDDLALDRP